MMVNQIKSHRNCNWATQGGYILIRYVKYTGTFTGIVSKGFIYQGDSNKSDFSVNIKNFQKTIILIIIDFKLPIHISVYAIIQSCYNAL